MELTINGEPVFANTGGRDFNPDLPAIVLVHGSGFDHTAWRYQARYLAHHGMSVAAVDLPGHGRSGGSPLATVADMADWVNDVIGALGCEQAIVVGHSLGGLIALEAASRQPSVSGIVLLGAATEMRVHPEMLESSQEGTTHVLSLMSAWMHGGHQGGHPDPGRWMMGESWVLQEETGLSVLYTDLNACHTYDDGAEAAPRVSCPALVLAGRFDRMVPMRAARTLADLLPDGRLVEMPRSGHLCFVEEPWETTKLIAEFVREVVG